MTIEKILLDLLQPELSKFEYRDRTQSEDEQEVLEDFCKWLVQHYRKEATHE